MKRNFAMFFALIVTLVGRSFGEYANEIDWQYGKPGVRVVTNAQSRAEAKTGFLAGSNYVDAAIDALTPAGIGGATATQGEHADTAYGWGDHALAGYLLATATADWETGPHLNWLTVETDAKALAALSTNQVMRLYNTAGTSWIDGTGGVWQVSAITNSAMANWTVVITTPVYNGAGLLVATNGTWVFDDPIGVPPLSAGQYGIQNVALDGRRWSIYNSSGGPYYLTLHIVDTINTDPARSQYLSQYQNPSTYTNAIVTAWSGVGLGQARITYTPITWIVSTVTNPAPGVVFADALAAATNTPTGTIRAGYFWGDGSLVTNVNGIYAANLTQRVDGDGQVWQRSGTLTVTGSGASYNGPTTGSLLYFDSLYYEETGEVYYTNTVWMLYLETAPTTRWYLNKADSPEWGAFISDTFSIPSAALSNNTGFALGTVALSYLTAGTTWYLVDRLAYASQLNQYPTLAYHSAAMAAEETARTNSIAVATAAATNTATGGARFGALALGTGDPITEWPTGGAAGASTLTPIVNVATGAVTTITWSSTPRINYIELATQTTITNSLTTLGNCASNATIELWVNATSTNALSPVLDARLQWAQGVPDMTVTGLYKFVLSSPCGTNIQARQTWPTRYAWKSANMGTKDSADSATFGTSYISLASTASNMFWVIQHPTPYAPVVLRLQFDTTVAAVSTTPHGIYMATGGAGGPITAGTDQLATIFNGEAFYNGVAYRTLPTLYIPAAPAPTYGGASIRIDLRRANTVATGSVIAFSPFWHEANELETAYAAGWSP